MGVYDGTHSIEFKVERLSQIQGEYMPELLEFFSSSESRVFDIYFDHPERGQLLRITISRSVPLDDLLKLGALIYSNG